MAYNHRSNNFNQAEKAVLTTILYSDIFDFPLTQDELWMYLISTHAVSKQAFEKSFRSLGSYIEAIDGFWVMKNRKSIIAKRKKNLPEVARKITLAGVVATKLATIPSIQFIGISGGLAAGKAEKNDDVDFFIIVKKNTLFVSRFWISAMLELLGVRRKRGVSHAANKICVNLIVDEAAMTWPQDKRDIYTAREIAQCQPLFERQNTYGVFLKQNSWIQDFLPNYMHDTMGRFVSQNHDADGKRFLFLMMTMSLFEPLMRSMQKVYMYRHKTTETVTNHNLAFHPKDYRAETLSQLNLKLRHLGLLTKF